MRDDQLGVAGRVTVTKDDTTIVRGGGTKAAIEARAAEIRQQMEETTSDWDREKLQERLARLTGGVAVIKVGAATEVEMKERKSRVEDALAATRAAIEEGVVVGGGVALLRAIPAVEALKLEGTARVGADIVARALREPLRIIAENAGLEGQVVVNEVAGAKGDHGFDAVTETYGDLIERGVIDPTKVVVVSAGPCDIDRHHRAQHRRADRRCAGERGRPPAAAATRTAAVAGWAWTTTTWTSSVGHTARLHDPAATGCP